MLKFRNALAAVILLVTGSGLFVGCIRSGDKASDDVNVNTADIDFARAAAVTNYTEITLGKLDTLKALDSAVKDYGKMMVADHNTSDSLLKSIAIPLGLSIPDTLDDAHQALRVQLTGLSGRAFDSVYIHSQVLDHQAAIALFTTEAQQGQQFQLKLYANNQLPKLQEHLDKATVLAANY